MMTALRIRTTVLPGGRIEVCSHDLPDGADIDVIVLMNPSERGINRLSAVDILAQAPGHRLFQSAEEVDAYIREERAAWDR